MKISDIKGDRVLDVIADVIEPIGRISEDKNAKKLFERRPAPKGKTANEAFAQRVVKYAPAIIRAHKSDIIEILAAIDGVTAEEYQEGMTAATLLKDVYDLLTDEDFLSFLSSPETETSGESAGED